MAEYRNRALEELIEQTDAESEVVVNWKSVRVKHCSQSLAFSYLRNTGFYGISNNRQMNNLFRFALASYDNDVFSGVGMGFLDVVEKNCCFLVIKSNGIGDAVAILDKLEKMCEIAGFDQIKVVTNKFMDKVVRYLDRERGLYDRYDFRRNCFWKTIGTNKED